MSAKIKNLYIARLTTQERPCFVCSKFTSVVLTSADNSNDDWFYTCRAHLGDFNFCSRVNDPSSPKPTQKQKSTIEEPLKNRKPESDSVVDLVSSIGSAFKSWRSSNNKEDDKKEEKEKEEEEKKKKDDKDKDKENEEKEKKEDKETVSSTTSEPQKQQQQQPKFILQRDYFYLRQREYIKKLQKKHAEQTLKTLDFPSVPKGKPISK